MDRYLLLGALIACVLLAKKIKAEQNPGQHIIDAHLRAEEEARRRLQAELEQERATEAHESEVDALLNCLSKQSAENCEVNELLSSLGVSVNPQAGPHFR